MDPNDDHKSQMNGPNDFEAMPDPAAVKELFGALLDAHEAIEDGESLDAADELKQTARLALDSASPAVSRAARELMEAHERADSGLFCEPKLLGGENGQPTNVTGAQLIAPVIEGYLVGDEIGRGGFGIVYKAQQLVPVKRPVAIKLLRTDFATPEMVSRFRAEASVLARMSHDGIARVIDAGLDHINRPFVAMELIEGESIVSYCDRHKLEVRERVDLFTQVCQAVHHAHQRAVIHRDLKPANIMVENRDGVVCPRVIDFGIAKLMEDDEHEHRTLDGHRLGTPRYMSPEQRSGEGDVDVRIDIFALGALLCEILTGRVPTEITKDGLGKEQTTPPSVLVADEKTSRSSLSKALRGDLDKIILKAIEIDPNMRYQSALAFGEDLQRYLDGLPILIAEPSLVYRSIKFVHRHRFTSAFASVTVLALIIGGLGLFVGLSRAQASERETASALKESQRQLLRAEFVSRFLLEDMLGAIDPNVNMGHEVTVREVFDSASTQLAQRVDLDAQTQIATLRLIGFGYRSIGAHDEALAAFRKAAELADGFYGSPSAESIEIKLYIYDLIVSNGRGGMTKLGEELNQEALAVLSPADPLFRSVRLRTSDTIEELRLILDQLQADPNSDPNDALRTLSSLGSLYAFSFDPVNEVQIRQQSYELSLQLYGPDHSSTFNRLAHYGALRMRTHPDRETLDLLYQAYEPARRILGLEHPVTLSCMRTYADLLGRLGETDASIALLEENERGYRARFGASSTYHTATSSILGQQYLRADRPVDALPWLLQVRDDRARQWSDGHMYNVIARIDLAKCYLALGKAEEAKLEAMAAIEIAKPGTWRSIHGHLLLAESFALLGLDEQTVIWADEACNWFASSGASKAGYFETGDRIVQKLKDLNMNTQAQRVLDQLAASRMNLGG